MSYTNLTESEKKQAPHIGAETATLTIAEDSCDGEFDNYLSWLDENFPELEIEPLRRTSGGSGLLVDGEQDDANWYWESFCMSHVAD